MKPKRRRIAWLASCAQAVVALSPCGAAPSAHADELSEGIFAGWDISGSNTFRMDFYDNVGAQENSPYQFRGLHPYDELTATFAKRISPYERVRGQFGAVVNESRYRSTQENLIVERFGFTWEKGDAALPYRLETGDFFGFYSFRTLQQALKGIQLEVQPQGGLFGERHSFVISNGFVNPNYRDIDVGADYYGGGSWLVEHPALGRIAFNGVYNFREADIASATPERDQTVFSLAAQRDIVLAGRKLGFEAEAAYFRGDYGSGSATALDQVDSSFMAQLADRGSGTPLSYSLRFELTGNDFRPNGAAVAANRRSYELRGGWRFASGQNLAGRLQRFTDSLEDANSSETDTAGLTLSGPIPYLDFPGASLRLDTFVQEQQSRDRATDTMTQSLTLDLGAPLDRAWTGRLGFNWIETSDRNTEINTISRQATFGADRRLRVLGLEGALSPGLFARTQSGPTESTEVGPSLGINLSGRGHSLNANYRLLAQLRNNSDNLDTHDVGLNYGYQTGPHSLGVNLQYQKRQPDTAANSTDSFKIGVFWRIAFARAASPSGVPPPIAPAAPAAKDPTAFRLTAIGLGTERTAAERVLETFGIRGPVVQPGATVYEAPILPDIDARQRLALEHRQGRVTRVALIVDIDQTASGASIAQLFERVRETFLRQYGAPSSTFEQGRITATLVTDLNAGRLIRFSEWQTPAGLIRLGLPSRLDRQVRIEAQLAPSLPPPRETLWSIETVR